LDSKRVKQSFISVAFVAVQVAHWAAFVDWIAYFVDQAVDYADFSTWVVD
jgi:hypothetical protein